MTKTFPKHLITLLKQMISIILKYYNDLQYHMNFTISKFMKLGH